MSVVTEAETTLPDMDVVTGNPEKSAANPLSPSTLPEPKKTALPETASFWIIARTIWPEISTTFPDTEVLTGNMPDKFMKLPDTDVVTAPATVTVPLMATILPDMDVETGSVPEKFI